MGSTVYNVGKRAKALCVIHSSLIVFVIKRDVANQITSVVGVLCYWICCGLLFQPYLV